MPQSPSLLPKYRGRFAPTPSGPLHFGSIVAALASALEARSHDGEWLLRIENPDPPREVPGASDTILRTLEAYGFEWDGAVIYQHQRVEAYRDALHELEKAGHVFCCLCSRKHLADSPRGLDGPVYPGTCRGRPYQARAAVRLQVPPGRVRFEDAELGQVSCRIREECGDFVLRRADGVFSYQLAVVVDDGAQGITHVVRGADLLTSTPRQIVLQERLGLATPRYRHIAVALDESGHKLSKQTLALPVHASAALPTLVSACRHLGLPPLPDLTELGDFWRWAVQSWPLRKPLPIRGRRLPSSLCNP